MLLIPNSVFVNFVAHLGKRGVAANCFTEYKKWLRYYLDFCDKYPVPDSKSERVRLFTEKLCEKKQSETQRERAAHAVSLFLEMQKQEVKEEVTDHQAKTPLEERAETSEQPQHPIANPAQTDQPPFFRRTSNYSETGYVMKTDSPEWDEL